MITQTIRCEADLNAYIGKLRRFALRKGKTYLGTFKQARRARSIQQNRLYWLWLTCLSQETGNEREALHTYFAEKYLPRAEVKGFEAYVRVSTTSLDTTQFSEYLEHVEREAAEVGVELVHPEDQHWDEFFEFYNGRV